LTVEEKTEKYRESKSKWANRVQFSRLHLLNRGLLLNARETQKFGYWKISNSGEEYTENNLIKSDNLNKILNEIDELIKSLEKFPTLQEQFNPTDLINLQRISIKLYLGE